MVHDTMVNANNIVILTHMSPDGDAMGSSLSMYWYLKQTKPEASVHVIVPNAFPDFLAWLPSAEDIVIYDKHREEAEQLLDAAEAVVITDFNEPKRIGSLGTKFLEVLAAKGEALEVLVIDHHIVSGERTLPDAPNITKHIDPTKSSTCQYIFELLYPLSNSEAVSQRSGLTSNFSTCLYTGLMTDTGNFAFNSNKPELYEIIARLVAAGVDKDAIYNRVFNAWSADRMKLVGYCLYNKMRIFPEYHTALIYLSGKELYRFNFKSGDAEGIVNMPLSISDVYYSCFMREDKVQPFEEAFANGSKKKIKISMSSQGNRPVNIFCHDIFSGGGHMNASGGEYYGPLTEAVKLFLENYPKYFSRD